MMVQEEKTRYKVMAVAVVLLFILVSFLVVQSFQHQQGEPWAPGPLPMQVTAPSNPV